MKLSPEQNEVIWLAISGTFKDIVKIGEGSVGHTGVGLLLIEAARKIHEFYYYVSDSE